MPYTFNDDAIGLVDSNLNQVAVSQSQAITPLSQSGYIQMGVSGSTALYMHVTNTGDLFVTGTMTTTPSGIQTITGSATINNFPITQSVKIDQTITLPVSISNFPVTQTIAGIVTASNPSIGGTGSLTPFSGTLVAGSDGTNLRPIKVLSDGTQFITGSISGLTFISGSNLSVFITSSNTLPITGSITVNNPTIFPTTQSVKIDQSILLPISVSNFPSIQTITGIVTASNPSIGGTGSILPFSGTLVAGSDGTNLRPIKTLIDGTQIITGSISGLTFVSGSNLSVFVTGSNVLPITGSITVNNQITFPTTQSVKIDQSITLPTSNASGSQVDGHSATIGSTTDPDTALTLIGRTKNLLSRIPATLIGGRFDVNLGGVTGLEAATNGTITVLSASVGPSIQGMAVVNFNITGTWVATLIIQASVDGGTKYFTVPGIDEQGVPVSTISANGNVTVPCGGYSNVRLTAVAYTSGTVSIAFRAGLGTNKYASISSWFGSTTPTVGQKAMSASLPIVIANNQTAVPISGIVTASNPSIGGTGSVAPASGTLIAGSDGTNLRIIKTLSDGTQVITGSVTGLTFVSGSNLSVFITGSNVLPVTGVLTVNNFPTTQSVKVDSWFGSTAPTVGQKNSTGSIPVVLSNDINQKLTAQLFGYTYSSFSPDPAGYPVTINTPINLDASNRLETHSTVTTDEGSFRDDFSGTSLSSSLTGTTTFTAGLATVAGSGTAYTTEVRIGQWLKKTSDPETNFVQINTVNGATVISLTTGYPGTSAASTAFISDWLTVTPTGGSIAVSGSLLSIGSGTANGATGYIQRNGDYGPYTLSVFASISQRIANQTTIIGFRDTFTSTDKQAIVSFSGTNNTQVNLITTFSSGSSDTQTTTVTLPNGAVTSNFNIYKIDVSATQVTLSINGVTLAAHTQHIPGPYDALNIFAGTLNTAVVTATTLTIDYFYFSNVDRVQIDHDFQGEPIPVQGISANGQPVSGSPLLSAGSDGTNTRILKTTTDGTLFITGSVAAVVTNPSVGVNNSSIPLSSSLVAGSDGTNLRPFKVLTDGTQIITGSISGLTFVSGSNLSVFITGSNVIPVTGSFFQINQPVTQSVKIDQSITLPISVSNFPTTQTITGSVSVNNLTFVSGANLSVFITSSNVLPITGTVLSLPFGVQTIAGTVTATNPSIGDLDSTAPISGTLIGGSDGTNIRAIKVLANGTQVITGSINGLTFVSGSNLSVFITGSNVLPITGSVTIVMTSGSYGGQVEGRTPNNSAVVSNPVLVAGSDGTNTRILKTTTDGTIFVTGSITTIVTNPSVGINNSIIPLSSSLVAGSDGTNLRPIKVLSDGTQIISGSINGLTFISGSNLSVFVTGSNTLTTNTVDGSKTTYSATAVSFTAANTPTDIFTIAGSATKVIRITRISFSATQTTATQRDILLIKRSTANTGGTSVVVTNIPHDSANVAATAVVRNYTANPTALGTTVGTVKGRKVFIGTTTGNSDEFIIDFGTRNSQSVVLRGTTQIFAVNLNSVTSAGNSITINIEWTEE